MYVTDQIIIARQCSQHYVKTEFEVEKRISYIDDFMSVEIPHSDEVMKAWIEEVSDMKLYKNRFLKPAEREAIKQIK